MDGWKHLCFTWTNTDGKVEVFFQGEQVSTELTGKKVGQTIDGNGNFILGQEMDSHGGSFSSSQAYLGSLSGLNVWSVVLRSSVITAMARGCSAFEGDAVSWRHFRKSFSGNIELKELATCSYPSKLMIIFRHQQSRHTRRDVLQGHGVRDSCERSIFIGKSCHENKSPKFKSVCIEVGDKTTQVNCSCTTPQRYVRCNTSQRHVRCNMSQQYVRCNMSQRHVRGNTPQRYFRCNTPQRYVRCNTPQRYVRCNTPQRYIRCNTSQWHVRCNMSQRYVRCSMSQQYVRCNMSQRHVRCNTPQRYFRCNMSQRHVCCNMSQQYVRCNMSQRHVHCNTPQRYVRCNMSQRHVRCNTSQRHVHNDMSTTRPLVWPSIARSYRTCGALRPGKGLWPFLGCSNKKAAHWIGQSYSTQWLYSRLHDPGQKRCLLFELHPRYTCNIWQK